MRIRLYLDEDSMREGLVRALRSRGVDVLTAREAQLIAARSAEDMVGSAEFLGAWA